MLGQDVHAAARGRAERARRAPSWSSCSPALVRREVLGLQSDPRSPEQGQYTFLQDLLRHVAYETLSKRERRASTSPPPSTSRRREGGRGGRGRRLPLLDAFQADPDAEAWPATWATRRRDAAPRRRARRLARRLRPRHSATSSRRPSSPTSRGRPGRRRSNGRAGQRWHSEPASPMNGGGLFAQAIELPPLPRGDHARGRARHHLAGDGQPQYSRRTRIERQLKRMEQAYEVDLEPDAPDADLALLLDPPRRRPHWVRRPSPRGAGRRLDGARTRPRRVAPRARVPPAAMEQQGQDDRRARGGRRKPAPSSRQAGSTSHTEQVARRARAEQPLRSAFGLQRDGYADSLRAIFEQIAHSCSPWIGDRRQEWFQALAEMSLRAVSCSAAGRKRSPGSPRSPTR